MSNYFSLRSLALSAESVVATNSYSTASTAALRGSPAPFSHTLYPISHQSLGLGVTLSTLWGQLTCPLTTSCQDSHKSLPPGFPASVPISLHLTFCVMGIFPRAGMSEIEVLPCLYELG